MAEIHYGLERLPRSKKRQLLEQRFTLFARELARVSWTEDVSAHFGRLKAALERRGRLIPDLDLTIAAHALAHGATLVTADQHMARIPDLTIEDWSQ